MKRKSSIVCKCINLVLSEIVLICLLCSCTSNKESVDFNNSATNKEGQNMESGDNQSQGSKDVSSDQAPVSAGVSSNQSQDSVHANTKQSDDTSNDGGEKSPLSLEESYKAILLDNRNFISTDLQNKELNLSEIKKVVTDDEDITVNVSKFTIIDLGDNGENEVVLWIQINGVSDFGFEILQYKNRDVYGYTLPYREFMNLKTDGTFIFSSGAADSGIGKLIFSENGYTVDKLYYSEGQYDPNNEFKIQYFANGEVCSEEEFNNAMSQQEEKTNVKWYDLSAKSVDSALESAY